MRHTRPLLGLVITGLTLTGCATNGEGAPHPTAAPTSTTAALPASAAAPAAVTIAKISAHSTLIPLGINTDPTVDPVGAMQVPSVHTPQQAGYYARGGVIPGQPGPPLVIVGHVNGDGQQGVYARLNELVPGDTATVTLADRTVLTFRVTSIESDPKTDFPGEKVFGFRDHATMVAITCGGAFDKKAHSYLNNIVVFMDLVT